MVDVDVKLTLTDEAATEALAERIADEARPGDVIALVGGLGTGKTVFARAFIHALGADDEEVPSPTFSLVQTYIAGGLLIHHFDLYRLEDPEEAMELGIEDAFADGVSLIEWPDRLGPYLPADRLDVRLEVGENEGARTVMLRAHDGWRDRLAEMGLG
jgi:tRNA threonylcarbamoyladenosine biosynthesis protein TsaE